MGRLIFMLVFLCVIVSSGRLRIEKSIWFGRMLRKFFLETLDKLYKDAIIDAVSGG